MNVLILKITSHTILFDRKAVCDLAQSAVAAEYSNWFSAEW